MGMIVYEVTPEGSLVERSQYLEQAGGIRCIAVSPDGKRALSGGQDERLHYWELDTGLL